MEIEFSENVCISRFTSSFAQSLPTSLYSVFFFFFFFFDSSIRHDDFNIKVYLFLNLTPTLSLKSENPDQLYLKPFFFFFCGSNCGSEFPVSENKEQI